MKYETTPNKIRKSYKKSSDNKIKLDKKETDKKTVRYSEKNINDTIVTLYDSGWTTFESTKISGVEDDTKLYNIDCTICIGL